MEKGGGLTRRIGEEERGRGHGPDPPRLLPLPGAAATVRSGYACLPSLRLLAGAPPFACLRSRTAFPLVDGGDDDDADDDDDDNYSSLHSSHMLLKSFVEERRAGAQSAEQVPHRCN